MKRLIFLFIFATVLAEPVKINTPGITGMVSNVDFTENRITDARWLLNTDITTSPGLVQRRHGIKTIGSNAQKAIIAYGFISPDNKRKQVILSIWNTSTLKTGIGTTYDPSDTASKVFGYSVLFGSGYINTVPFGGVVMSGDIGMMQAEEHLFVFDGRSIPAIYCDEQSYRGPYIQEPDTVAYRPRMVSLGLEAPGQPRVAVIDEVSSLYGYYRYSYRQAQTEAIDGAAIPSPWIFVDSQRVALSMFELASKLNAVKTDTIYILRQKLNQPWKRGSLTTILTDTTTAYFIDSNGGAWTTTGFNPVIDSQHPGKLSFMAEYSDTLRDGAEAHIAYIDSTYWVAYSYYDQVLDLESPLGPYAKGQLVKDFGTDTVLTKVRKGFSKDSERPKWIRVYRSLANDSSIMYGLWQVRSNMIYPKDSATYPKDMFPGWSSDTELVVGNIFMSDSADTSYPYSFNYCDILTDGGVPITRPPLITGLEIPFSTMAYANGRLWGAGDPLYPNRVYYSDYDELTGWLATNYIECGGAMNDQIVALHVLPDTDGDMLIVFRRNDIWAIAGYDDQTAVYPAVEEPARVRLRLTSKCGAVNRKNVVSANDMIYFLSPNMKIYRISNSTAEEISGPIENYLDSFFVDLYHSDSNVVSYRMEDKVVWYNSTINRAMAYNILSQTWSVESYSDNFRPAGSFAYDTSKEVYGRAERSYWLFQSDSASKFRVEYESFVDSTDTAYAFQFNLQPPMIGDGEQFYMIKDIQVTATLSDSTWLIGYVIDENADTVATDSVQLWGYSTVKMGFPRHVGKYLSVMLSVSNNTQAMIHDVMINPVALGQARIQ